MITEYSKENFEKIIAHLRCMAIANLKIEKVPNSDNCSATYTMISELSTEEQEVAKKNLFGDPKKTANAIYDIKAYIDAMEHNAVYMFELEFDSMALDGTYVNYMTRKSFDEYEKDDKPAPVKEEPVKQEEISMPDNGISLQAEDPITALRMKFSDNNPKTGLFTRVSVGGKQKKYTEQTALDVIGVLEKILKEE